MKIEDFEKKSDEIVAELRVTEDGDEKLRLQRAWFDAAIQTFNEEFAGDYQLADGRILTQPTIGL